MVLSRTLPFGAVNLEKNNSIMIRGSTPWSNSVFTTLGSIGVRMPRVNSSVSVVPRSKVGEFCAPSAGEIVPEAKDVFVKGTEAVAPADSWIEPWMFERS